MVVLSFAWIGGTVFAVVVLIASAFVKSRPAGQYYFLLSEQVPTVSSDLSFAALIAFPVSAAIGLLVGWYYMHEDSFRRAIWFNLAPCLNLFVLGIDALL